MIAPTKYLAQLEKFSWLPVLGLRAWIAEVFFSSGLTKIASWDSTISLFADEYKVPVLPPELAAYMSTAVELSAPVLLVLGLGTRFSALALLGMTAVIEFTYMHFEVHKIWALVLLLLVVQGAGRVSVDYYIRKWLENRGS